jgi:hypothetical protein
VGYIESLNGSYLRRGKKSLEDEERECSGLWNNEHLSTATVLVLRVDIGVIMLDHELHNFFTPGRVACQGDALRLLRNSASMSFHSTEACQSAQLTYKILDRQQFHERATAVSRNHKIIRGSALYSSRTDSLVMVVYGTQSHDFDPSNRKTPVCSRALCQNCK